MKKSLKIWIIIATALVVLGSFLFVGVMFFAQWDFSKIGTSKYETNTYEITENFGNISIDTDTADISFELSSDDTCKVVCFEEEKARHEVSAKENHLVIKKTSQKAWYDYIGINFASPKITVYLPETAFNSVYIKESTGDVSIEKMSVISLDINLSTGDVFLSDVACKILSTSGNTGDVYLKNVTAAKNLSITRSTGDIELLNSDAFEISVNTDTGDVKGTLLSPKIFITQTDTGKIDVPHTTEGGKCEITTDTGDIEIEVKDGI